MKNKINNKYFLFFLALILWVSGFFLYKVSVEKALPSVTQFQRVLHEKERRLEKEMAFLSKRADSVDYNTLFITKPNYYNDLLEKEGLVLLVYENDTLKFWSNNSIAVENWIKEVCLDTKMAKLKNGWFEVLRPKTNTISSKIVVGLILIKSEYPYQNKYLKNEFQKDFAISNETKLLVDSEKNNDPIYNYEGDYLFSLALANTNANNSFFLVLSIVITLLSFVCLIAALKLFFLSAFNKFHKNYAVIFFIALVVLLRFFSIKFAVPQSLYALDLFSPQIFANASSVWLSSLGDMLINVVLLFYLTYLFFTDCEFNNLVQRLRSLNKLLLAFAFFLAFFAFSWFINSLFIGLIKNSNISFEINNIFSLTIYSYVAITIVGFLLFVYFLCADKMVVVLKQLELNNKQYAFVFILSAVIHSFISHAIGTFDFLVVLWPFVLILFIIIVKRKKSDYSFTTVVFLVFLFSIYSVHLFLKHTQIKEQENRKVYAEKLALEQDPIAELLFLDIEKRIQKDSILSAQITGTEKQPDAFENRIKQEYFSDYWEKYMVQIALFDSMCVPVVKSSNPLFDNNFYFDDLIAKRGKSTSSESFHFINSTSGKTSYLVKLPFYRNVKTKAKFGTLYIELDSKFIADEIGFPELLLDRNVGLWQELNNYSYAKYKNQSLVSCFGKYLYENTNASFSDQTNYFDFIDKDEYNHLFYRPNSETLIVLSKKVDGFIGKATSFSYLFTFFSLLLLLILLVKQISLGRFFESFSFKNRIQVLLVFIVLTSLVLFGTGTVYYIKQQFHFKNNELISEKIHSVLMDLENKISTENELNKDLSEYVSFMLKRSAAVFFTDINFYDVNGNLYASSRSKIFDEGLTSKKMNPEAFLQMAVVGKTEFVNDERIGELKYLSAYIPFRNKEGKLLAYLNLPYFSKQSELEKEISGFLVALINIYVLLFALSIIAAILIANYVTKPLKLIQDKLSKIKLGKANEPIEWKDNDEIGNLVSEYNRMIEELSNSAELLAKSERESAWREMAKQVAHEIKNPLTPIKLSVQHLQHIWKENSPDMEEKVTRLTKTIIEQIDTLSTIANEFSNFAKMPKANLEKVNLQEILSNSILLFKDLENVTIQFKTELQSEVVVVLADKEQLLRVFNNLIKNAIQSIPEDREGEINVELKAENNHLIITVTDNGIGISDDLLEKIFVPNFTTKTGGMGLGLAMVKNIVEGVNGKVGFRTKINEGTQFYVELPRLN